MKWSKPIGLTCLITTLICGCQGPETRVLPRHTANPDSPYQLTQAAAILEEVNPFYLQESLEFLSSMPRIPGSAEETNAAEYLKRLLTEYGYEVTMQRFLVSTRDEMQYGTNVVAAKKSSGIDGDIFLVTTNHDTGAGSPGANDNASGVVTFLETARLLSTIPSDSEIRFVSFSGRGPEYQGARYYLSELTEQEKQRIVGVIHLDTLGYLYDEDTVMGTADGKATFLGDRLEEMADKLLDKVWNYRIDDKSCHILFEQYRIPAVRLTQSITSFERGTVQDRSEIVDVEKLGEISRVLSQTLIQMMRDDTYSYVKASQEGVYARDGALTQRTDRGIPFGLSRKEVEYAYGQTGELLDLPDMEEGQCYRYLMKWLNVDQILLSDFLYVDGALVKVMMEPQLVGIEFEEMQQRLEVLYGQPKQVDDEGAMYLRDYAGNMYFVLKQTDDGCTLEVIPAEEEDALFARFDLHPKDGSGTVFDALADEAVAARERAALELVTQILRIEEQEQITAIVLFSDGIGGKQVYWAEDLALYVDLEDMTDAEGNYRDYTESCRQMVQAYAYFFEEEYSGLFYEKFDKTNENRFETAFRTFVLTSRPQNEFLEADLEILFFYQFEPLVQVRDDIRSQMDLSY